MDCNISDSVRSCVIVRYATDSIPARRLTGESGAATQLERTSLCCHSIQCTAVEKR